MDKILNMIDKAEKKLLIRIKKLKFKIKKILLKILLKIKLKEEIIKEI